MIQRLKLAARTLIKGAPPAIYASKQAQDANIRELRPITAEEVAEARLFFPLQKFFIFGHARSGTTLLARLIRLHPEVHCNWQLHLFTRPPLLRSLVASPEIGSWLARRSNRWNHGVDLSPLVLRAAADFIMEREARQVGKTIVGDKSPNSLLDGEAVHLMAAVYPDGRLLYIARDGRDTVLSHRFQAFIDIVHHLSKEDLRIREAFIQDPQPFLNGERSLFTESGIRQAAEGWVRNMQETDQAGKALLGDHYLSLRYEDLLANPWEEMSRVWSFLGTSTPADSSTPAGSEQEKTSQDGLRQGVLAEMQANPDADWQQEKASEIARAMQKGKEGNWRQMFTARDRQIFEEVAGETLAAWGYTQT
jgi:LPS sulfotransferase NodH